MSTEWQGGNLLATAAGVLLKNSKFDMLHHRGSSTTGSLVDYTHRKQFRTGHPYYVFFFYFSYYLWWRENSYEGGTNWKETDGTR